MKLRKKESKWSQQKLDQIMDRSSVERNNKSKRQMKVKK